MLSDHNASPVNPLPPVVLALFAAVALPEFAFSLGARGLIGGADAVGWRISAIERFGFSGEILDWMVATRQFPVEHLWRFVTYPFVHAAFSQTLFACVMRLALGKMVAEQSVPRRSMEDGTATTACPLVVPFPGWDALRQADGETIKQWLLSQQFLYGGSVSMWARASRRTGGRTSPRRPPWAQPTTRPTWA